ncbi:resolvase, partial [Bacillus cereus]|uniref:recombinase family protein n=1 Tax=Bacillus cereus TaxID=1396 RepID=UPI000BFACC48
MKYGYARVSTLHQDLGSKIQTLQNEGCEEIYSEKFIGTKTDRPKFQELLSILKTGDMLVVTKL